MKATSLDQFYQRFATALATDPHTLQPPDGAQQVGHFNLFNIADQFQHYPQLPLMPYDRRAYYKISLLRGRSRAEYANKVLELERNALLFATPRVPYHWVPEDGAQAGRFCVFTPEFLLPAHSGVVLDELLLFQASGFPFLRCRTPIGRNWRLFFARWSVNWRRLIPTSTTCCAPTCWN